MLPMLAVREQLGILLAADATTLAPGTNANKLALIVAPFTPSENLTASGLTLGASHGLTPITGVTGAQSVGIDPVTGEQVIYIKSPAGGYQWVSSGSFPPPITLYGIALLDTTLATLIAVEAFTTAISVSAAGQIVDVDPVTLTFVLTPMS